MYKSIYKNIKKDIQKKEQFLESFFKSEGDHGIHDKKPHFIFSAENPYHPSKLNMSHDETIDFLRQKGYNAEGMNGKYGSEEKSIIIHNPPKNSFKHLNNLAASMGQDSSIISDGYNHEMHYLNGPKAGKHHKGEGTVFHEKEPSDYYSTLDDGTHFTHGFDFDKLHTDSKFIKDIAGTMKKSEDFIKNNVFRLKKAESGPKHKFAMAGPGTKLVHYSRQQGLTELNPDFAGTGTKGEDTKQGKGKHSVTWYYGEGVEPESIVTSGSKSKYITDLGNKKLYDIGKDPHGLWGKAQESAQQKADEYAKSKGWVGRSMTNTEDVRNEYHQAIKDAGFHGIFNSGLDNTMSHAVGMFEAMKPEAEHPLHPEDFKKTSAKSYHAVDNQKDEAKSFAQENGHHNHEFLHNLKSKLGE